MGAVEVTRSADFKRISRLPRRRILEVDAAAWAKVWTEELRLPGSKRKLNPWQGISIAEVVANNGGYIALPVGSGKTDITFALPVALEVERAVLIVVTRGLRDKTHAEFSTLRKHWRAPRTPIRVLTTSELTRESKAGLLRQIRPQLIMIDECDDLANPEASVVQRIDRYVQEFPDTIVVGLTGTPGRLSIMNYWHHLAWCLRERAPVPLVRSAAELWAAAIDIDKTGRDGYRRVGPGVLGGTIDAARKWYLTRLTETPGVVIVDQDSAADIPLEIRVRLAKEDPVLDEEFRLFLKGDIANDRPPLQTPSGDSVSDPLSRWRYDGQLGCGFFTYFDPPPPIEWLDARYAKNKFVRRQIEKSRRTTRPIDTEAQVFRRFPDHPAIERWREVRGMYDAAKHSKAEWLSDSVLQSAREWLREVEADGDRGIVWSGAIEFAEALRKMTKLPYYGPKGTDQHGRNLHAADPTKSMICSWHANKRGFNLQAWRRMLVVMPPQSAKYLEQIFGRAHRQGQTKAVLIEVLATSGGTLYGFERAIQEAQFNRDTVGMTQKILRAKVRRARPRVTKTNRYRWTQKELTTG